MKRHPKFLLPADRRQGAAIAGAIIVFVLAVWFFLELADDAPEGDYLKLEEKILLSLREGDNYSQPVGPHWLEQTAVDLTALGGIPITIVFTLLVGGFLLLRKRYRTTLFIFASIMGGMALNFYLKQLFGRARPDLIPHLTDVQTASFPSGHSMLSSIVYLTLGAIVARAVASSREKIYFLSAAILLTVLIGLTRVYLGVHYPTDVLAGWAAGTAWALLCWGVAGWLQVRGHLRQR